MRPKPWEAVIRNENMQESMQEQSAILVYTPLTEIKLLPRAVVAQLLEKISLSLSISDLFQHRQNLTRFFMCMMRWDIITV